MASIVGRHHRQSLCRRRGCTHGCGRCVFCAVTCLDSEDGADRVVFRTSIYLCASRMARLASSVRAARLLSVEFFASGYEPTCPSTTRNVRV
eukprot:2641903-Prymnesium_polylepis.1